MKLPLSPIFVQGSGQMALEDRSAALSSLPCESTFLTRQHSEQDGTHYSGDENEVCITSREKIVFCVDRSDYCDHDDPTMPFGHGLTSAMSRFVLVTEFLRVHDQGFN